MRADRNLFIENCSLIQKTTLVKKQFYTRGGQILSFWVVEGQIQIAWSGQSYGGAGFIGQTKVVQ